MKQGGVRRCIEHVAGFVIANPVKPIVLLFGGIDLAGAVWARFVLRQNRKA